MKEVNLTFNILDSIREVNPLIHIISNFVTMNDVAQSLSFLGARPIMAHYYKDVQYITKSSDGLVVNLGTMDNFREEGILESANIARYNSIPWILDPVGIQGSHYRKNLAIELIDKGSPNVIKGNLSEIKSILGRKSIYKGIDSLEESLMVNKELQREIEDYARNSNVIIVITGEVDFITDGKTTYYVYNGDGIMSRVTGTGCILSVLIGAFISVEKSKENLTLAVVEAVSFWGIIGEVCKGELKKSEGLNTYRFKLLDKISLISKKDLML
ncbi:hydroxyethylthiazole kinase, partial [Clostridium sp.]|uniref:hydroxyethylthiazole kinase n=1 Tax=Clostridium sp. TaxID=1506 RepID=UPI0034646715